MQIVFIFTLVLFTTIFSSASDCRSARWPFRGDIKSLQPIEFQAYKRAHLFEYLYNELSLAPEKRTPYLANKLFFYLKNSEINEDRYNLLMALEWAAELQLKTPRVIPLTEICALESKIKREPSSLKRKKLKSDKK
ncbi:MAG: hypothetical protein H7328_13420 [Bdellovibrio sp.]|nr:hypothetical protein [Bdellovibrio sp.]